MMKVPIAALIFSVSIFGIVQYASATFKIHPNWPHGMDKICGSSHVKEKPSFRVIKGVDSQLGQYPWLARIYASAGNSPPEYSCGGTLITDRHVISAAHCVVSDEFSIEITEIVLGDWDISTQIDCQFGECAPPTQIRKPRLITIPKEYSSTRFVDDISVISLDRPVEINDFVIPACLPDGNLFVNDGDRVIVAGWGLTKNPPLVSTVTELMEFYKAAMPHTLQWVGLIALPVTECQKQFFLTELSVNNQICAINRTDANACSGDSGGPLLSNFHNEERGILTYVTGIVSFGNRICGPGPAVYTRVTGYLEFILDNLRE